MIGFTIFNFGLNIILLFVSAFSEAKHSWIIKNNKRKFEIKIKEYEKEKAVLDE